MQVTIDFLSLLLHDFNNCKNVIQIYMEKEVSVPVLSTLLATMMMLMTVHVIQTQSM